MLKRAQGLSLEVIVIAVITILVLTVVVLFATGAWSRLISSEKKLEETATPEDLFNFKLSCQNACFQAKQLARNSNEWLTSDYCKKTLKVNKTTYYCWSPDIDVKCMKTFQTPSGGTTNCINCDCT
jgi:hypothetical protein